MEIPYIGIDGCRSGWFVAGINKDGKVHTGLFADIDSLVGAFPGAMQFLIDMPIGLPFREKRACDFEARKKLSPHRSSSVFSVPSRNSLYAPSYEEACQVNLDLMGNKLSKQSWNIGKKITEVDLFLTQNPGFKGILRECHPEIAFWSLNKGKAMMHSKKTAEGQEQRLSILCQYLPEAGPAYDLAQKKWRRKDLAKDDILDALVLAIAASFPLKSLPPNPPLDRRSLPMEIVYPDTGS